jgi:predicted PurR-regulated permease PerM
MMYIAREVLIPVAFAVVLSLIWSSPVSWLQRALGRTPAVLVVVIVSMGAAATTGWVIFHQLVAVVNGLPDYRQNIHDKFAAFRSPTKGSIGEIAASVQQIGNELSPGPPVELPGRLDSKGHPIPAAGTAAPLAVRIVEDPAGAVDYLRDVARRFVGPLGVCGVVIIFSIFLLIERLDVRNRFLRLTGLRQMSVMTLALDDATQRVSRYLLLQFAVNAVFGLAIGSGLHLIGLPYAALWGSVAALLRFVPYLGTLIAGTLPLLLSIAVFEDWMRPALVLALFGVLEIIIANWVEPRLYGAHTGVSSLAILLGAVFWALLWGPAGLILSTPLTVCVAVLGRHLPQLSFLHILLGDEPVLSEEAQFYQRLLAMDQSEAQDVARLFLNGRSLTELYDSVIAPALAMAESDRHKGALDTAREKFIFLSVREMIAEFSDDRSERPTVRDHQDQKTRVGPTFHGRALCVPAGDDADEITASMLAQLLAEKRISAIAFPAGPRLYDTLAIVEPQPEDVILLSALPPFAFARTLSVARQFRLRFPKTKLVVGVWGFKGDVEKALARFDEPRPDRLLTSLAEAVGHFDPITSPAIPDTSRHEFQDLPM